MHDALFIFTLAFINSFVLLVMISPKAEDGWNWLAVYTQSVNIEYKTADNLFCLWVRRSHTSRHDFQFYVWCLGSTNPLCIDATFQP